MKKGIYLFILLNLALSPFMPSLRVNAISSSVVIAEVMTGSSQSGSDELIELTNVSDTMHDMADWQVRYVPASGNISSSKILKTFQTGIKAHGSITLKSQTITAAADLTYDISAGMSATGGTLQLLDANGMVIDMVGWGNESSLREGTAAVAPAEDHSISRSNNSDTDNNSQDFALTTTPNFVGGGMVEIEIDLCSNIIGMQITVPTGYTRQADGTCVASSTPGTSPASELMPPTLNELLPDPSLLSDSEGEFIELYNPNEVVFPMKDYQLKVGSKSFTFTANHTIPARAYLVVYSVETKLTLSNSGAVVQVLAPETAEVVDETPQYPAVDSDQAFARFVDGWKLTDQPTPGQANILVELSEEEVGGRGGVTSSVSTDCPVGKYRNPATNRCKNLETTVTTALASCDEDEYRSPDTNRCRKVQAATTTTPCQAGYERNPATNRCRKIASSIADLAACKEGYERNPDTNRCRKIAAAKNVITPATIEPNGVNLWLAGAGVSAVAGYGIWEWRREIWGGVKKIFPSSGS